MTIPLPLLPTRVTKRIIRPLSDFFQKEASAGILLVLAAVAAIVWANSPWSASYLELWSTHAQISVGNFELNLTLKEWVNDGAMVLFFFVVGLEIKRELTQGELRDPRQAALPIIAAVGGMIVPAIIYYSFNSGGVGAPGWGIPMATDIAIVMGVVALLGKRAPQWLKLFLLALAIVDDIGAIVVIAIFYSEGVSFAWLGLSVATIIIAAAIRQRVPVMGVYLLLGLICWLGLHEAHVHPTLAGVAFGMLSPVIPRRQTDWIDADELADKPGYQAALKVSRQAQWTVSIVEWLENRLHPYSAFVVVPIFALANAGIKIPVNEVDNALSNPVTWGVVLGLVIGKMVGISVATLGAVALKIGRLPEGVTPRYVIGAGALGGIGFTVSLFVTELAFGDTMVGTDARLGVVVASLIAAIVGTVIMIPGSLENDRSMATSQPRTG
ncbi:MAG: Na+/H+ antiporter NhaA [Ilumatobacter coccineus]|uniref:Na(+)/H(+) antiporter NhaA n=1 Tax=Ilumatobacter coccineus TaxID=467094 RepID=A0A2G6KBZ4_9ACTN|nr:MAG: Na+/H+ antiporter NhaA [Ilumatobacter coccineus]